MIEASRVHTAWHENFSTRGELGASCCVWSDHGEAVSLAGGLVSRDPRAAPWTPETLVPVWSTTKGPASATLLLTLHQEGLTLGTPVRHVWPELGAEVTFAQLLSHQAALAALDVEVSVFDHRAAAAALERQVPNWRTGAGHGYHPRTFGVLLEECVRRLSGAPLGEVWRREIADPLDFTLPDGRRLFLGGSAPGANPNK